MTPAVFVLLAVAGGAGAAMRLLIDGLVRDRLGARFPWGTNVINASGSLLLGLLTGLAAHGRLGPEWLAVLGAGLLGGYTTFSTASYETVRLVEQRRFAAGAANGLGMLLVCGAAALLGLALGGA